MRALCTAFLGFSQCLANGRSQRAIGRTGQGSFEIPQIFPASQFASLAIVDNEGHEQVIGKCVVHGADIGITQVNTSELADCASEKFVEGRRVSLRGSGVGSTEILGGRLRGPIGGLS